MLSLVRLIPDQLEYGWKAVGAVVESIPKDVPASLAVCGMGGSGVSGDILRGLLLHTSPIPIEVVKDYTLPGWIKNQAFAVLISYSGDTEEALALWEALTERGVQRLAITSVGKLKELAEAEKVPTVTVPSGIPPRAAVGYLFAPLLRLVDYWNLYPEAEQELTATLELLRSRMSEWEKETEKLAQSLKDHFPIIHSLDQRFAAVAYRLVCQLNENAKVLAHAHVYSEMNHNEIMGFEGGVDENIALIVLDPGDEFTHPRNRKRAEIVDKILPSSIPRLVIHAEGESLLDRFFSLLVKGDLLSVFLAELRGVDPFPVASIDRLKKELS
ncbi:MAG: bifunctional phosphoglucose/phosphomannose isomerase [Candidatus Stahlbacteria bacterium]|nr:MAG: bifunctional phosphoglucose/phosphomannose isomerase [Candidatus Stahlbacteria bacterium]